MIKNARTILLLVILAGSTLGLTGCVSTNPPAPVIGVDIVQVKKGEVAPFSGTIFSPFYLDRYLEWKESK